MPSQHNRTFSLPDEQSDYIDGLVASRAYGSASEVVEAGLQALKERERAVDQWLRDEVVPVYDALKADPSRAIPAETVFAELRAHHADRVTRQHGS